MEIISSASHRPVIGAPGFTRHKKASLPLEKIKYLSKGRLLLIDLIPAKHKVCVKDRIEGS